MPVRTPVNSGFARNRRPPSASPPAASRLTAPIQVAVQRLLVAFLLLVFGAQAASSIVTKSATWDETNYFGMGDYLLRTQRWDVPSAVIHPPLAYYLDSLPLLFADLDRRVWDYPPGTRRDLAFLGAADTRRGQALLSSPANENDRLLTLSRLMAILQALVLGYFVYRLGRALYGYSGGILALGFFAFCPNTIAYGSLIAPDITLTVFFFITVFYLRMALVTGEGRNHLLAGISLGLALLSKFPALLLLPIWAVFLAFAAAGGRRIPVRWIAASAGCAAAVFLLGYGFDPRPYVQGLAVQQIHQQGGHWSFLMGQLSRDGWWYTASWRSR